MEYPKLPDELNRAKKLTSEDVQRVKDLRKFGLSLQDIASEFGVTVGCIFYHVSTTGWRERQYQSRLLRERQKIRDDPEYHKKRNKASIESRKYRKKVNPEYLKYKAEVARKKYWKKKSNPLSNITKIWKRN